MKSGKIVSAAIFATIIFSQLGLYAQAGPPGPGSGAPIDGGALMLVLGAAAYGYTRLKRNEASEKGNKANIPPQ